MEEKVTKKSKKSRKSQTFPLFEEENVVSPLKIFISIVPYGQGDALIKILEHTGVTFNFITSGEGTGKNYLTGLLSGADIKKQIIFSLVREDKTDIVIDALRTRFSTSKVANGISLSVKLTSVAGVSVYRFLTNTRKVKKVKNDDEF